MTKKTKDKGWTVLFWIIGVVAIVGIIVGMVIFLVDLFRNLTTNSTTPVETTAETEEWTDFTVDDSIALGWFDPMRHVNMSEITWEKDPDVYFVTPKLWRQFGNQRMRDGDVFFEMVNSNSEVKLLKSVNLERDPFEYIDQEGLGRSFNYAGMYAWEAKNYYIIPGDEEDIGKRYLFILEDNNVITAIVDTVDTSDLESERIAVKWAYEIDDGYVPEEYPITDGHGNIIG